MWNWTENQIELYLIRHGMTLGNVEHRYIGRQTDETFELQLLRQFMPQYVQVQQGGCEQRYRFFVYRIYCL